MPAIYRQYRPQTFAEITGQTHVTQTLTHAIQKNLLSHAYVFQGPRGTGKTTTARVFAKRLNCTNATSAEPCGTCKICVATQEHRNMDVIEIDAASNRGIDDIRALRESVGLSPSMGKYKVYIIDEVHMLTNEAFAALLKTLEEPVQHAIFILATTELHKMPSTILSRCQVFRFKRATPEEMRKRLQHILKQEKRSVSDDVISFIINRSDGCYRDAESLLGQILSTQEGEITLGGVTSMLGLPSPTLIQDFLSAILQGNSMQAIQIADDAYNQGFDPEQFIQESIRVARDGAVEIAKKSPSLPSFAQLPDAGKRLPSIIRALIQAKQDIDYVPEPMLAIQLAVLTTSQSSSTPAPQAPAASPAPSSVYSFQKAMKPQPKIETQKVKQETPVPSPIHSSTVQAITDGWQQVIQMVQKTNPVGSTFLRATEPMKMEGDLVTLRVEFPLHKNFFEKPENKEVVEKAIASIVGKPVHIMCYLEQGKSLTEIREERQKQEEEVLKNVQEVFGVKP